MERPEPAEVGSEEAFSQVAAEGAEMEECEHNTRRSKGWASDEPQQRK